MSTTVTFLKTDGIVCCHEQEDRKRDENATRHCHDAYELLFFVEGKGKICVEGCSYLFSPGTVMLIAPFEYHAIEAENAFCQDSYSLLFSDSVLSKETRELLKEMMPNDGEHGSRLSPSLHMIEPLISSFERFREAEKLPSEKRELYAKSLLSEILVLISSASSDKRMADERELAVRVLRFLNQRPGQNLSLDAIAKHFFISKFYLCRVFKAYNGISIHEYLLKKRVLVAKQLMESGETASGAAYRVGFGDYSAFYRAYMKVMGTSPVTVIRKKG